MGLEVSCVFALDFIELGIGTIRIVVKHDQRADFGIGGELAQWRD